MAKNVVKFDEDNVSEFVLAYRQEEISYEQFLEGADEILGSNLFKDERLDTLKGVPFAIVGATFRPGLKGQDGELKDYVSLNCVVGDEEKMRKAGVRMEEKDFAPREMIVINDGSTGIRRQVVAYLHTKGYIVLPEPIVTGGKLGESTFDIPANRWKDVAKGNIGTTVEGDVVYQVEFRLSAPRGIRSSTYTANATGKLTTTRYIA